jgi:hypothetical protein
MIFTHKRTATGFHDTQIIYSIYRCDKCDYETLKIMKSVLHVLVNSLINVRQEVSLLLNVIIVNIMIDIKTVRLVTIDDLILMNVVVHL